jgi:hypothetical protein
MPTPPSKRDYRAEYKKYQSKPKNRRMNDDRKQARRDYEAKHGNLPSNVDIGHKKALIHGGGGGLSNLRVESQKHNRGFARGKANRPRK